MDRKIVAARLFRGVFGGDPSVVDKLASEGTVSTYPVFDRLFNTPDIRGREAYKSFAIGFGNRWVDA